MSFGPSVAAIRNLTNSCEVIGVTIRILWEDARLLFFVFIVRLDSKKPFKTMKVSPSFDRIVDLELEFRMFPFQAPSTRQSKHLEIPPLSHLFEVVCP